MSSRSFHRQTCRPAFRLYRSSRNRDTKLVRGGVLYTVTYGMYPSLLLLFVVVVVTLTCIIKSVVTGQAPVTLELRNTPGKKTHNPRWYTHISQLTQFMPRPETYKSEIGSQSTMCQVQAGAYVSLLTPGETKYSDCRLPPKVVSITTHTHDRRKSIREKETKKRKEDKVRVFDQYGMECEGRLCKIVKSTRSL